MTGAVTGTVPRQVEHLSPPTTRRPDRRHPDRRRVAATVALAPVVFLLAASAGGGWSAAPVPWLVAVAATAVVGAATLATYVPGRGERARDALGCAPCAAMPAMTVVAAVALVASAPHTLGIALVALAVAASGLARRRSEAGQACPTA